MSLAANNGTLFSPLSESQLHSLTAEPSCVLSRTWHALIRRAAPDGL